MPAPGSYYLSWNANGAGDAVATLRDWLMAAAAAKPTDPSKPPRALSFLPDPAIFSQATFRATLL